jgi:hypothetical protein
VAEIEVPADDPTGGNATGEDATSSDPTGSDATDWGAGGSDATDRGAADSDAADSDATGRDPTGRNATGSDTTAGYAAEVLQHGTRRIAETGNGAAAINTAGAVGSCMAGPSPAGYCRSWDRTVTAPPERQL